jgi:hypothetical protein
LKTSFVKEAASNEGEQDTNGNAGKDDGDNDSTEVATHERESLRLSGARGQCEATNGCARQSLRLSGLGWQRPAENGNEQ